jgi:hypothetical protein
LSGGRLLFQRRDNVLILTFVALLRRGEKLSPLVHVQKAKKNKNSVPCCGFVCGGKHHRKTDKKTNCYIVSARLEVFERLLSLLQTAHVRVLLHEDIRRVML